MTKLKNAGHDSVGVHLPLHELHGIAEVHLPVAVEVQTRDDILNAGGARVGPESVLAEPAPEQNLGERAALLDEARRHLELFEVYGGAVVSVQDFEGAQQGLRQSGRPLVVPSPDMS